MQLTLREIKSRYKQSIVGYFWIIINPLAQMLIYSFIFSIIFRFPLNNIPYPVFLFVGLLPWVYLQTSLATSSLCLVDNSNLIKKVYFPREVLPYSVILAKAVDLFISLLVLLVFFYFYKIAVYPTIFFVVPLFAIQVMLMTGLTLVLSALNLFYRDVQYLTNLILMLWMYLTPIVYPLSLVPKQYVFFYKLNPMVGIVEGYRSAIFNSPFDKGAIITSILISLLVYLIGLSVFKRGEDVFADIV